MTFKYVTHPNEPQSYALDKKKIKHALIEAGLTMRQVAERVGIGSSYLSHLVAGRKRASEETAAKIAHSLGVSFRWIIKESYYRS